VTSKVASNRDHLVGTVAAKLSATIGSEDKCGDRTSAQGLGLGEELESRLLEDTTIVLADNENSV
jgi:hypothetical protein